MGVSISVLVFMMKMKHARIDWLRIIVIFEHLNGAWTIIVFPGRIWYYFPKKHRYLSRFQQFRCPGANVTGLKSGNSTLSD